MNWLTPARRRWADAAIVRAFRTTSQTAVAYITALTAAVVSDGKVAASVTDLDWPVVVGVSVLAGIVSLLTSIGGLPEVDEG